MKLYRVLYTAVFCFGLFNCKSRKQQFEQHYEMTALSSDSVLQIDSMSLLRTYDGALEVSITRLSVPDCLGRQFPTELIELKKHDKNKTIVKCFSLLDSQSNKYNDNRLEILHTTEQRNKPPPFSRLVFYLILLLVSLYLYLRFFRKPR